MQGLVSGLSQRKAYIQAGYSTKNKTDGYIDKEASLLFKNRKVFERYTELMDEHRDKALWTREEAVSTLKWLVDQSVLSIEGVDEGYVRKSTADAIIGSIQELNKLEKLYDLNTDLMRDKLVAEVAKAEAEARIEQNKADKLTSDEHTDELLKALINPPVKEDSHDDTV